MNKGIILQSLENQKIIGSTYEYYVKGLDGDREFTSETKSATITTGVKKYKYQVVEGSADPAEDGWREVETTGENESIKYKIIIKSFEINKKQNGNISFEGYSMVLSFSGK